VVIPWSRTATTWWAHVGDSRIYLIRAGQWCGADPRSLAGTAAGAAGPGARGGGGRASRPATRSTTAWARTSAQVEITPKAAPAGTRQPAPLHRRPVGSAAGAAESPMLPHRPAQRVVPQLMAQAERRAGARSGQPDRRGDDLARIGVRPWTTPFPPSTCRRANFPRRSRASKRRPGDTLTEDEIEKAIAEIKDALNRTRNRNPAAKSNYLRASGRSCQSPFPHSIVRLPPAI